MNNFQLFELFLFLKSACIKLIPFYFSVDDDRITRRESYLKATEGGRMHIDSDLSDGGDLSPHAIRRYVTFCRFYFVKFMFEISVFLFLAFFNSTFSLFESVEKVHYVEWSK